MHVGVYLPPQAADGPLPVLYWLSGLTCTEQNFISKAGAQRYAAEHGVILVAPDTSPRGDDIADADGYDIGKGAGFYLDATQAPWAAHYRMYDYVVNELPALIEAHFATTGVRAISGHSMGGHGALTIALKKTRDAIAACRRFSPIVAPSQVPWGEKAFSQYLGDDRATWNAYDATALIADAQERLPLLIDQGDADEFLQKPAENSVVRRCGQGSRLSGDGAAATRLRPQLLLHLKLYGRAHCASCCGLAGMSVGGCGRDVG